MQVKTTRKGIHLAASTAIFAVLMAIPIGVQADPDAIRRLAADFDFFGLGEEASTVLTVDPGDPTAGGISIYEKTVFVPEKTNTMYITMYTTGDTHDGAASCFSCLVDGAFCNPGGQGAARCALGAAGPVPVPGWITLLKEPAGHAGTNCDDGVGGSGDCHDNAIAYSWCTPIEKGVHTVQLRMASSTGGTVFVEQAHFYVDVSRIRGENRCVDPTPGGPGRPPPSL